MENMNNIFWHGGYGFQTNYMGKQPSKLFLGVQGTYLNHSGIGIISWASQIFFEELSSSYVFLKKFNGFFTFGVHGGFQES